MREYTAALISRALNRVMALFASPVGRHARRRRSTRVRRYAPLPAPSALPQPAAAAPASAKRPDIPPPPYNPWLAAPAQTLAAEDVALVRPYYAAHEAELDRIQAEAVARLNSWTGARVGVPA